MAAKNRMNGQGEEGGEEIQRLTAGSKAAVVLDVIKGRATPADLARQHDLTVGEIEGWVALCPALARFSRKDRDLAFACAILIRGDQYIKWRVIECPFDIGLSGYLFFVSGFLIGTKLSFESYINNFT